ncbi:hypothetical protein [Motilibacter aurantiacus]|uniref:hypothetical protein n=1 Tax=Motilibacter aurantiacus TaxID=2714955 RepID=UPI00140803BF|nr:hypothetical protein [Motilibacter aurantiacus]NHC45625.1 hypothetical protein [Motilibacter aurantiacus]
MPASQPARNPYLVLGVPFGTSGQEATKAFARQSRRARRGIGPYTLEDLTWALHEIEHGEHDPAADAGLYRVPALPEATAWPSPEAPDPPVRPLPRRTEPRTPQEVEALRGAAAQELLKSALAAVPDPVEDDGDTAPA